MSKIVNINTEVHRCEFEVTEERGRKVITLLAWNHVGRDYYDGLSDEPTEAEWSAVHERARAFNDRVSEDDKRLGPKVRDLLLGGRGPEPTGEVVLRGDACEFVIWDDPKSIQEIGFFAIRPAYLGVGVREYDDDVATMLWLIYLAYRSDPRGFYLHARDREVVARLADVCCDLFQIAISDCDQQERVHDHWYFSGNTDGFVWLVDACPCCGQDHMRVGAPLSDPLAHVGRRGSGLRAWRKHALVEATEHG